MNAHGDTVADRLYDLPFRAQEIALHGIQAGATTALAAAQLHHRAQLADSLTPSFVEEHAMMKASTSWWRSSLTVQMLLLASSLPGR